MYATIDELSDDPVTVTLEGERVRIRYGRGATFSLDIGEAVDLVDAVATVLGEVASATAQPVARARALATAGEVAQ